MDEIYKIASTERIQVLEKELATQLTELKRERELALKKTLQVAESKSLVIQPDVMQRELESCLKREYTPENLPLLLLQ
ncbi:hypothetical protein Celaphus_00018881, partial [Cervus elaphus hippelaphus]